MKVKQNLLILIWANPSKKDRNSLLPLYARVTIDGKRAEISLGYKISPDKWNKITGTLKGNSSEIKTINNHQITLKDKDFVVATNKSPGRSYYPC